MCASAEMRLHKLCKTILKACKGGSEQLHESPRQSSDPANPSRTGHPT